MNVNYPLNAVTTKKLANLTGYTEGALRKKIHDGVFVQGIHFLKSPDGRIQFILEEYNKWVLESGRRG
jgi:hypothetical protein